MLSRFVLKQFLRVYRYERWILNHFTETGHILLLLMFLAGIYGIDTHATLSFQLFVLLLILFFFAFLLSLIPVPEYHFERKLPRYATADVAFNYLIKLKINISKPASHNLSLIDGLHQPFPDYPTLKNFFQLHLKPWYQRYLSYQNWREFLQTLRGADTHVSTLKAIATQEVSCSITPIRRGKLVFSHLTLMKSDLLGLINSRISVPHTDQILVLPKWYEMPDICLTGHSELRRPGLSQSVKSGCSTEFYQLSDYRPGDSINHIHWKSVARHGKLMVKQFQNEVIQKNALLLDTFAENVSHDQFEAAVSLTTSLLFQFKKEWVNIDAIVLNDTLYESHSSIFQMDYFLETLAIVETEEEDWIRNIDRIINLISDFDTLVCVFLHWDHNRQLLVQALNSMQISVMLFYVLDSRISAQPEIDPRLPMFQFDCLNLEQDLTNFSIAK